MRSALVQHFPQIAELDLVDYKVRILDGGLGTGAVTRVLIETAEKGRRWTTVGVSENVIAASWLALEDAISYIPMYMKSHITVNLADRELSGVHFY